MADDCRAINRVFTRGVINDLLEGGSSEVFDIVVRRHVKDPESKTHGQIISEIYTLLGSQHRNEYYYMNTLLNKLLVGIHSVNSTTALSQVRIGLHIADFVMLNDDGRIYEIKSDLDNYDRLFAQLSDYFKAFSKVSVLADMNGRERVECVLSGFGDMGRAVGIYALSERDTIFSRLRGREPERFDNYLEHLCIFKLLRKVEYMTIISDYFGELPQVPPAFLFRA
ncbi:MAG: sce7726 family protein, partial [Deltaproteobacteria bacterium]|nr:sce7726 family protein [Deltaproteobacteria bacterium]